MCDPFSLAVASTFAATAATGYGIYSQNQAINAQNDLNANWRNWQDEQKKKAQSEEERLRSQAEGARNAALTDLGVTKQGEAQTTEATRLTDLYNSNPTVNMANVNDALLSGQSEGGTEFKTDVAKRLAKASQDARARIAALATVNSFGGSQNGLANRNNQILQASDQQINLRNDMRQGNLAAYGIAKAVQPQTLSPVTDYASGIGNALAGLAGQQWGQYAAKV